MGTLKTSEFIVAYPNIENIIPDMVKAIHFNIKDWDKVGAKLPSDQMAMVIFNRLARVVITKNCYPEEHEQNLQALLGLTVVLINRSKKSKDLTAFDAIWVQCKDIIRFNAIEKRKGNSWQEMEWWFWKRKMSEEVGEVLQAETPELQMKEFYDVINICLFMLDQLITRRKLIEAKTK